MYFCRPGTWNVETERSGVQLQPECYFDSKNNLTNRTVFEKLSVKIPALRRWHLPKVTTISKKIYSTDTCWRKKKQYWNTRICLTLDNQLVRFQQRRLFLSLSSFFSCQEVCVKGWGFVWGSPLPCQHVYFVDNHNHTK